MTFATKDEAIDALEVARADWLALARSEAVKIAVACATRTCTIEDVRRAVPMPEGIDPRVAGAVFRDAGVWEPAGYEQGTRSMSHRRPIMRYALAGQP